MKVALEKIVVEQQIVSKVFIGSVARATG